MLTWVACLHVCTKMLCFYRFDRFWTNFKTDNVI